MSGFPHTDFWENKEKTSTGVVTSYVRVMRDYRHDEPVQEEAMVALSGSTTLTRIYAPST